MKNFFNERALYVGGIIVFTIGILGRFISYGNSNFNFIFENMIWFPIELFITLFFVERIVSNINDKNEYKKTANLYKRYAAEPLGSFLNNMKHNLAMAYIEKFDEGLTDDQQIYNLLNDDSLVFNIEKFSKGKRVLHVDKLSEENIINTVRNPQYKIITFNLAILQYSEQSRKLLTNILENVNFALPYEIILKLNEMNAYLNENALTNHSETSSLYQGILNSMVENGDSKSINHSMKLSKELLETHYQSLKDLETLSKQFSEV